MFVSATIAYKFLLQRSRWTEAIIFGAISGVASLVGFFILGLEGLVATNLMNFAAVFFTAKFWSKTTDQVSLKIMILAVALHFVFGILFGITILAVIVSGMSIIAP